MSHGMDYALYCTVYVAHGNRVHRARLCPSQPQPASLCSLEAAKDPKGPTLLMIGATHSIGRRRAVRRSDDQSPPSSASSWTGLFAPPVVFALGSPQLGDGLARGLPVAFTGDVFWIELGEAGEAGRARLLSPPLDAARWIAGMRGWPASAGWLLVWPGVTRFRKGCSRNDVEGAVFKHAGAAWSVMSESGCCCCCCCCC
jgi:hypothetical protein